MITTFIYALCEPGTRTVRYIGKANDPEKRFKGHIQDSIKLNSHLGCWLRSLRSRGVTPNMVVLREVSYDQWEIAEERYIRLARGCGIKLLNLTDGGEGITMTPEIRRKIGKANRGKLSAATRAASIAWSTGRPMSEKARIALLTANTGRPCSEATRKAIGDAQRGEKNHMFGRRGENNPNFGRKQSPEAVEKNRIARTGRKISQAHKNAIGNSHRGRKRCETAILNMRAGQHARRLRENIQ